jgi:hypothetical protein
VITRRTFSTAADLEATMPHHSGTRLDRLNVAIVSLQSEARRLERLGFETPLAECRRQLRYCEFVRALFTLEPLPIAVGVLRARDAR